MTILPSLCRFGLPENADYTTNMQVRSIPAIEGLAAVRDVAKSQFPAASNLAYV